MLKVFGKCVQNFFFQSAPPISARLYNFTHIHFWCLLKYSVKEWVNDSIQPFSHQCGWFSIERIQKENWHSLKLGHAPWHKKKMHAHVQKSSHYIWRKEANRNPQILNPGGVSGNNRALFHTVNQFPISTTKYSHALMSADQLRLLLSVRPRMSRT